MKSTNNEDILKIFARTKAILKGSHFVYTQKDPTRECPSGWFHGHTYVNKDAVYPYTEEVSSLCREIARRFADKKVEVVIAPEKGGIILSQWVAHHIGLKTNRPTLALFAEKDGDSFVVKRGYDKLLTGKRVLVVEDILTSGGSARKTVEVAQSLGGKVIGLGALCNRGGVKPEDVGDVPILTALVNLNLRIWPEEICPLCEQGIPVNVDVGKGKEFLARRRQVAV
ncbi:MAG: phosphoribosyltransferase [Candidatus Colwellbacteria bacterium]|nr:phosphoribosyltransferase [Candidatus Colwellbacteria bacterium]